MDQTELYISHNRACLSIVLTRAGIRLTQKLGDDVTAEAKSFYLFSDNCSEKEDFYHAMLQAQEHHQEHTTGNALPVPLKFDTPDLVKLVQQLHASEENLHTRWVNALIGRLFLALYKTEQIKEYIATKITKKIARVPKPALITSIQLQKIDMGTLPPFITNPKLKELTVDGDLVVEADISYKGNFRIEICAIARIDLGSRFKAREVTIILAGILKRFEGHILLRIKPPPSNRLWMTFEIPPRMELSLEPIVSSRQITYGVILRAMESRIREVVNETLVLPNWDDTPFTDTIAQAFRGGIWEDSRGKEDEKHEIVDDASVLEAATTEAEKPDDKSDANSFTLSISSSLESEESGAAVSSSTDHKPPAARPRAMRSSSSVHMDSANASAEIVNDRNSMTPTSTRSMAAPTSPSRSSMRSAMTESVAESPGASAEDVSTPSSFSADGADLGGSHSIGARHTRSTSKQDLSEEQVAAAAAAAAGANQNKRTSLNQSFNVATAAARNWLASKQNAQATRAANHIDSKLAPALGTTSTDGDSTAADTASWQGGNISKSHTVPMGRGQPLPPPGTPLPLPPGKRPTWGVPIPKASTFANLTKRKPVADAQAPFSGSTASTTGLCDGQEMKTMVPHEEGREEGGTRRRSSAASGEGMAPPPLPRRRQRQPSVHLGGGYEFGRDGEGESLFVVEAPLVEGSGLSTPEEEGRNAVGYGEKKSEFRGEGRDEQTRRRSSGGGRGTRPDRENEDNVAQVHGY